LNLLSGILAISGAHKNNGRFAMEESYEGDGYEFSLCLPSYQRLRIHVTRAALEVLNEGRPSADQLGILIRHMSLLHQLARQRHDQHGSARIVIEAVDVRGIAAAQAADKLYALSRRSVKGQEAWGISKLGPVVGI
jgi:hypothetical protein